MPGTLQGFLSHAESLDQSYAQCFVLKFVIPAHNKLDLTGCHMLRDAMAIVARSGQVNPDAGLWNPDVVSGAASHFGWLPDDNLIPGVSRVDTGAERLFRHRAPAPNPP